MKLNLSDNITGNDRNSKDISKIILEGDWINAFNISACHFSKLAQRIKVALVTFNGNDSYRDTLLFGNLGHSFVELFNLG